jgi:hypothetical protein|eukprot:COSAG02_NODE_771_length_17362_cov_7.601286_5_plen_171_part_00
MRLALSAAASCFLAIASAEPTGSPVPAETHHFEALKKTDTKPGNDLRHAGAPACSNDHTKKCNTDALKMECLYDPKCAGFNTDGWLKTATAGRTVKQSACDLYVKTAGAPAKTHFLKIDRWDADFEDEPGRPHHKGEDVAKLEALCSKDPACAGFVSAIRSSCYSFVPGV